MSGRRATGERHEEEAWFQTVRAILMRHWDPLGVNDKPLAFDEYDAYARRITAMLRDDEPDVRRIDGFLADVEHDWMGIPDADPRARRETVSLLNGLRRARVPH